MDVVGPYSLPYVPEGSEGEHAPHQRAADRTGLGRVRRADLFQLAQGLDLWRLERDPAADHRQGDLRTLGRDVVMPGLDPGIPTFERRDGYHRDRDGRDQPGHDKDNGMDFDFSDEQRLLKDSVDRLVADRYGFEARKRFACRAQRFFARELVDSSPSSGLLAVPFSRGAWRHRRRAGRDHDRHGGIRARACGRALSGDRGAGRRSHAPRLAARHSRRNCCLSIAAGELILGFRPGRAQLAL